jgi:class 3 adenylate cyclase
VAGRDLCYRWRWRLEAEPAALWPLVADTNRFNRDAGVPALEEGQFGDNARRTLGFSRFGIAVAWEEEPFEWVEPHRFSVRRRYRRGPLAEMDVAVELVPGPDGGTELAYDVRTKPRNLLGRIASAAQIGLLSRRRFEATFRTYDRLALAHMPAPSARAPATDLSDARSVGHGRPELVPGGDRRADAAKAVLLGEGLDPELVERLASLVTSAHDLDAARIRPYALVDAWGADRRQLLVLCLHATRAGLLELRWDLLCPLCRGARESFASLAELESTVHCDTCRIDFAADFTRSVELSFGPCEAVREVTAAQFCVAGPQVTPHVIAQQLLGPGETRTIQPHLDAGRYRVRSLGRDGFLPVRVEPGGASEAEIAVTESWQETELRVGTRPTLLLHNDAGPEQLVIVERTAWGDDAVTAAEVTALQVFRDLFSNEALRPGEPISVGTLTVLFTDLRDSTRFYREVGDAPAFGTVMDHLDVLRAAVAQEDGAVVKTLGDAIMAVFRRPLPAVRAAMDAQRRVASPPPGGRRLVLKVGIHTGPCIAVTQNGLLDYFGSTVNLAARLVPLSSGADVVVSEAVLADPEVGDGLDDGTFSTERIEATLKGFEEESFRLWRLTRTGRGQVGEEQRAAAAR